MPDRPHQYDIYTDQRVWVGTADSKVVHQFGLWHDVFSALVINPDRRTCVLQVKDAGRHEFQREFELDFSVGGHLVAGESVADGVREVREELGLAVSAKELTFVGLRQTSASLSLAYTERAFQHWHILPVSQKLASYRPSDSEVSALAELRLRDAWKVAIGELESVEAELSTRTPEGDWTSSPLTVTRESFVRNYLRVDEIFPRMFLAAEHLLDGVSPTYW